MQTPPTGGRGQPWRPGTPPPAPAGHPGGADIRIGYARCSRLSQELDSQLDALTAHGIPRDKVFSEKISTRVRVRPQFEQALRTARKIKAHALHCRVIVTVYEMKRLGRDAAELTALTDRLTAHGLVLEMLAGPLPGIYDPTGPGKLLFAFVAAMAKTERENIREPTLEGLDIAARKGKHGGRPPVITGDIVLGALATVGCATHQDWLPAIPLSSVTAGFGGAVVIGMLAGVYPAIRAARLPLTEALATLRERSR
ncbi:recombinase family protein [Streptomyces sp. NBS 14/10]|uniref:recombinase family protein n=1 Tax=Streptomyces sp. NBS 14/10 TaxID=1945643 RepID=UPI00351D147A